MGTTSISGWRHQFQGLSDYELAERVSQQNVAGNAIILRYKSQENVEFNSFGSCANDNDVVSYFTSEHCYDTEIFYINPAVPLDAIASGFRVTNDAPENSHVAEFKKLEEKRRIQKEENAKFLAEQERISKIRAKRISEKQCVNCGKKLHVLKRLLGGKTHSGCKEFVE